MEARTKIESALDQQLSQSREIALAAIASTGRLLEPRLFRSGSLC